MQSCSYSSEADTSDFVEQRTALHALYIREDMLTRRLSLVLAAGLLALAAVVSVFAPEGREGLSYAAGLALVVFAAGAIGYGNLRLNLAKQRLSAGNNQDKD